MTKMLMQQKQKTTKDSGEGGFDSHAKHLCCTENKSDVSLKQAKIWREKSLYLNKLKKKATISDLSKFS